MTTAPRIGVPMSLDLQGRLRTGPALYVSPAYATGLARAGALVMHLPPQSDATGLAAAIDALLLPGGDDFLPEGPYPAGVRFVPVPAEQLAFDRRLLAAALARELPVLGVCYGMQLLALELGGTLCYDVQTELPGADAHQLAAGATHPLVWAQTPSRLSSALHGLAQVNSRHHQSVADPGPRLRAVARAPDGVIEAIESEIDAPFWAGVQWHPEDCLEAHGQRLFDAFVEAARAG